MEVGAFLIWEKARHKRIEEQKEFKMLWYNLAEKQGSYLGIIANSYWRLNCTLDLRDLYIVMDWIFMPPTNSYA